MAHKRIYLIAAIPVLLFAAGPTFSPDVTFKGSSLTGWHALGSADWRAQNGEITGVARQDGGGWLVLDRSYQDAGFYASFRATAGVKTGVLLRAEKTPEGMKGIYVALTDGEIASYRVMLDAQGRETKREKLRPAGGQVRIAAPVDANAPGRGGRGGFIPGRGGPAGVTLP